VYAQVLLKEHKRKAAALTPILIVDSCHSGAWVHALAGLAEVFNLENAHAIRLFCYVTLFFKLTNRDLLLYTTSFHHNDYLRLLLPAKQTNSPLTARKAVFSHR
jgi:hypothetical protein